MADGRSQWEVVVKNPRVVVLMGVAGAGKTTIGKVLANQMAGRFYDADDFHSAVNLAKMAAGVPLGDEDRWPWLERMRKEVIDAAPADRFTVLACSALKRSYREALGVGTSGVVLVYLKVAEVTLRRRLEQRGNHFMKPGMLASQLAALEEPSVDEGLTVEVCAAVEKTVAMIVEAGFPTHIQKWNHREAG